MAAIRLDAVEKRVARVEQQHGAAVGATGGAEVLEVPAKERQSAAAIHGEDLAMQVRRANERQRGGPIRCVRVERRRAARQHRYREDRCCEPAGVNNRAKSKTKAVHRVPALMIRR